jgi:hypothetical protein
LEQLKTHTDEAEGMRVLVSVINQALKISQVNALRKIVVDGFMAELNAELGFEVSPAKVLLTSLCGKLDKDLIVFFDEADSLKERLLLSFLAQLRVGYVERMVAPFPSSIALIGMRNIRDYKAKIRPDSESLASASPFNIITESLSLANFTKDEVKTLYAQHTEATGQMFLDEALERAYYWSDGQPWLVNALARQVVFKILVRDYRQIITAEHIDQAADDLMKRRDTHIDSLMARLHEPRVKRFIESMLAASDEPAFQQLSNGDEDSYNDDLQYCLDLGLVKKRESLLPANPIYANVIMRYLNESIQWKIPKEIIGKWTDGQSIDMTGLLKEFQRFWALKSEKYLTGLHYLEAGPHILLSEFLQRVVNGGAAVMEEYADGQGYADIVVKYAGQNYVIELKIKDNQRSKQDSLKQILCYMDGLLIKEGWLVIFDRPSDKSWQEKTTWETVTMPKGEIIHVVGC